ncbi:MAG: alpha-1,2-fucosyltransferase [Treponemataceae bacterium]|nr:alpha-1,2-fucosyltransferase [Treponemataceae bacterium]
MVNFAAGEFLIVFLLIVNCARIFFLKYGRRDALVVLAPVCVVLSVLQIAAWNVDAFSAALLLLSVFGFIINFRALLRFMSGLYIDRYSVAFRISATLLFLAALAVGVILAFLRPVGINPAKSGVSVEKIRLYGTFSRGFERAGAFERADAVISIYESDDAAVRKNQTVVLVPDKRADSVQYMPYLVSLAQMGYTVCTGDFYAKDVRWLHNIGDIRYFRRAAMLFAYFRDPARFASEKEFYTYNAMQECKALLRFAEGLDASAIFFVGDSMTDTAVDDFSKLNQAEICGHLNLSSIPEYRTAGFGCVEQTMPLVARLLGCNRDSDLFVPKYLAMQTASLIPAPAEPQEEQ